MLQRHTSDVELRKLLASREEIPVVGLRDHLDKQIFLLDRRSNLVFRERAYNYMITRAYQPVVGDLVLRHPDSPRIESREGNTGQVSVRTAIEVVDGPHFAALVEAFRDFAKNTKGKARARLATWFMHHNFTYDDKFETVSANTEDIIGLRRGVCLDFAIVHAMLNNVDNGIHIKEIQLAKYRIVAGEVYGVKSTDQYVEQSEEGEGHAWVRTSSGLFVMDPTLNIASNATRNRALIPGEVRFNVPDEDGNPSDEKVTISLDKLGIVYSVPNYQLTVPDIVPSSINSDRAVYFEAVDQIRVLVRKDL